MKEYNVVCTELVKPSIIQLFICRNYFFQINIECTNRKALQVYRHCTLP